MYVLSFKYIFVLELMELVRLIIVAFLIVSFFSIQKLFIMNRVVNYFILPTYVLIILSTAVYSQSPVAIWSTIQEKDIVAKGKRYIIPKQYHTVKANFKALKQQLQLAPMERSKAADNQKVLLDIPMPDGDFHTFTIVEAPIMEPELAAKFPNIKSYFGRSVQDRSMTVRFDISHKAFHALIFTSTEQIYVDPYTLGDKEHYISYYKKHFTKQLGENQKLPSCSVGDVELAHLTKTQPQQADNETIKNKKAISSDGLFREYRIAIAATKLYTQFYGGTVTDGLAAINTTMTRVNGIYEREVALRMNLVANNDLIVYTDTNNPLINNNISTLINQTPTEIITTIGIDNFDIGHTLHTNGFSFAYLATSCTDSVKTVGFSGQNNPVGDPFDVELVAHEIGHQWGATHTFNGNTGGCGIDGRWYASTAYEPGSGTTIMSYGADCGLQNIQNHRDDYFHAANLAQIIAYSTDTEPEQGGSCAVTTPIGNQAPVVNAGPDYVIPHSTPFTLTGSATDADGDPLTYCWEQQDLGPQGNPYLPSGNAPLFRSFPPVNTSSRTFPQISDIINNTQTIGEILPSYPRDMNFSLMVRDNGATGLGGCIGADFMEVSVSSYGPFLVTSPDSDLTWNDCVQTVTWDVAGTDLTPINCANVNILLSTDGGLTYPIVLASNVPNTGSAMVSVPNLNTTTARVKVEGVGNIFFDISNTNFTIDFVCLTLELKLFLEGAYSTGSLMDIDLQTAVNVLPSVNPYGGIPWNHAAGESVTTQAAIPSNAVDWVLVELRDPVSFDWIQSVAGFLLNDGTVVATDGSIGLAFNVVPSNYHIIVRHRNHVDVMSNNPVSLTTGNNFYDFTDVNNIMNSNNQVVLLFGSTYGLHSGDVNADGIINVQDYNEYLNQSEGTTIDVYTSSDCDLDGNINTSDFNNYQPNSSHIGVFWIRY